MALLRKMYFGFLPLFWHALRMDSAFRVPRRVPRRVQHHRRFRMRYPRLLLGIIFLIILLVLLFTLPLSASSQPYLSIQDIPNHPPTSVTVDSDGTGLQPGHLEPPAIVPVTGN